MSALADYIDKLSKRLKRELSPERYRHSASVARLCRTLAERFGRDPDRCELSGWAHDIARELPAEELIRLAKELNRWEEGDERYPIILHGKVAAKLLKEEPGFYDSGIDESMCQHTTGKPGMSDEAKILFAADYFEEGRPYLTPADRLLVATAPLDAICAEAVKKSIEYLEKNGSPIHPDSRALYNSLRE